MTCLFSIVTNCLVVKARCLSSLLDDNLPRCSGTARRNQTPPPIQEMSVANAITNQNTTRLLNMIRTLLAILTLATTSLAQSEALIAGTGIWRYRADGSELGIAWRQPGYPDSCGSFGRAPLGRNNGDELTTLSPPAGATVYFRRSFMVENPTGYTAVTRRSCGSTVRSFSRATFPTASRRSARSRQMRSRARRRINS